MKSTDIGERSGLVVGHLPAFGNGLTIRRQPCLGIDGWGAGIHSMAERANLTDGTTAVMTGIDKYWRTIL